MKLVLTKDAQVWQAEVEGNAATYTWGKVDGKQQVQTDTYRAGKQKRNKEQQARFEAVAAAKKKVRLGYSLSAHEDLTAEEVAEFEEAAAAFHVAPAPMLALDLDAKRKAKLPPAVKRYVQKKLDGRRCLANLNTGALFSRGRKPMEGLPHISAAVLELRAAFPADIVWLDGEVYAHGLSFQTVTSLATGDTHTTKGDAAVLQYHVYDLVSPLPFSKRLELLIKAGLQDDDAAVADTNAAVAVPDAATMATTAATDNAVPPIVLVKTHAVVQDADMDRLHAKYVSAGYEGTVLRIDGVPYEEDKRSPSLLKRKDWQQEEFHVLEFLKEEHADTLGSVLLCDDEGLRFAATPSMTDADKLRIWQNQNTFVSQKATVKFFERFESGAPRFPVLLGFRDAADLGTSSASTSGAGAGTSSASTSGATSASVKKRATRQTKLAFVVDSDDEDEPKRKPKVTTRVKQPVIDEKAKAEAEKAKAKADAEAKAKIEALRAAAPNTLMPVFRKRRAAVVEPLAAAETTEPSTAIEPVTIESATVEHAAVEPAAIEHATVEHAAIEHAAVEPAATEPAAIEHAAVEPVAIEPTAIEPAATVEPDEAPIQSAQPSKRGKRTTKITASVTAVADAVAQAGAPADAHAEEEPTPIKTGTKRSRASEKPTRATRARK